MTSTQTTTTILRTLAVVVAMAVAAALAMASAGDALADKEGHHKKRPPAPAPVQGPIIAFTSIRDGNDEIYKMNEDGSNQTNLTNNAASDTQPEVSPDGTKIAFVSTRDKGGLNPDIYVMNADGSDQRNITSHIDSEKPAPDTMPTWSPDGSKIAFQSNRDGNMEIYTMDAATGGELENLTKNPARDVDPAWSPDGVTIAFDTNRDGNSEIYFMDSHGHNPYNLSGNPAADFGVSWAPDP